MTTLAEARRKNPRSTGLTQHIRESLGRESLSVDGIYLALGCVFTKKRIRSLLGQMVCHGEVVSTRLARGVFYSLRSGKVSPEPVRARQGSGQVAGRIEIGRGSVWGYRVGGQLVG